MDCRLRFFFGCNFRYTRTRKGQRFLNLLYICRKITLKDLDLYTRSWGQASQWPKPNQSWEAPLIKVSKEGEFLALSVYNRYLQNLNLIPHYTRWLTTLSRSRTSWKMFPAP